MPHRFFCLLFVINFLPSKEITLVISASTISVFQQNELQLKNDENYQGIFPAFTKGDNEPYDDQTEDFSWYLSFTASSFPLFPNRE